MYGTSENLELRKDTIPFKAGITNNVTISKISFENSKKDGSGDQNILAITFTAEDGATITHKEWDTKGDEGKTKNQMIRLKRFVKEITGNDFPTSFTSWEDCANKFIAAMGNYSNTKVQVKFLYNSKGYLEFPKYDSGIRSMSDPTLTLSTKEAEQCVKKTVAATTEEDLDMGPTENLDF